MEITHLQSATQIIRMGDVRILTDPWLTEGEYYGSWYHYPPFEIDDIKALAYDFIYVSHIHPDHLSAATFEKLPHRAPVLIHKYSSPFLKNKISQLGFPAIELAHGTPYFFRNGASITIYAADNCNPELCSKFMGCGHLETKLGSTQIDTFAVLEYNNRVIVNTNDCPFELAHETIVANSIHKKNIDLLMVGYCGAGPFPQCFEFNSSQEAILAAENKKLSFLKKAVDYINLLQPVTYAPFAGTYILGSRLSKLNEVRGVPTIEEAIRYIDINKSSESISLEFKSFETYDINKKVKSGGGKEPKISYLDYLEKISNNSLDYDNDVWDDQDLDGLVDQAWVRFNNKALEIGFASKTSIYVTSDKYSFVFGVDSPPKIMSHPFVEREPFVHVYLEHNLLHRLLRGPRFAHWNNAEIGSHLMFKRVPNSFERALYHCMCFFHQ